jgi:hypothetical protein
MRAGPRAPIKLTLATPCLTVTLLLLPFYFSGIAISAALTKFGYNIGRL